MDSNDNLVGTEDDEVSLESEEIEEIIDVEDVVSTGELSDEEGDGKEMSPESLLPSIEPSLSLHGHTANIFTVDLSEKLCASGGEDDIAYVWDIQSGTKLLECKGHKDSVICVRFNNKGNLLATGDMNGLIFVWDLTDFTLKTQFDINELEWLLWHPSADILLAGSKDGEVWMWLIPTSSCKVYPGDGSSCSAGQIVQPGTHLCAGYEDGSIRIWNLKDQSYVG